MTSAVLFLIVFKLISAPTWCFVIAWILFGVQAVRFIFSTIKFAYERGKENGNKSK